MRESGAGAGARFNFGMEIVGTALKALQTEVSRPTLFKPGEIAPVEAAAIAT